MSDELLDIVDDDDHVIAQEMRSIVHKLGLLHRGIHAFLVTPQNQLLVQVRSSQKEAYPLALDCSVSEHVKAGETYLQAAQRGLLEELGIQGARLSPLVKFKMVYGPNDIEVCVLYESKVDPTLVQFDPEEVQGVASYKLNDLEGLISNGEIEFSSWFVDLILWYVGKPSRMQVLKTYKQKKTLIFTQ